MWINTDDWTWAGFLLFFVQIAWIVTILNLFIQSLLLIIQMVGSGPSFGAELPVRLDIRNLTEQFNNQPSTDGAYFSIDSTVRTEFDAINIESVSNLWAYLISFMKLGSSIVAVFVLNLIKNVLIPLRRGKPFQPKSGRNLY